MQAISPAAFFLIALWGFILPASGSAAQDQTGNGEQVRTEIHYRDGIVVLLSDYQEKTKSFHRVKGNIRITFDDIVLTGDEAVYDEETRGGSVSGQVHFSQKQQWLSCSRAEFNFATQTGSFYDASGYTDRDFLITGKTIRKIGPDTYRVEDATATTCPEENPKWKFSASSTTIRIDNTARMRNAVFKIKGIPVLYTPYIVLPIGIKERNRGFTPFHTGNSTSKGRVFSEGYYLPLGRSADILAYGDHFSLRGLALGAIFRIRPNQTTRLSLQAYGIRDKLDQGGVQLNIDGESRLKEDWRAVVHASISSNVSFRQVFSENLNSATIPTEKAIGFVTRNHNSISTNIGFSREVTTFPVKSLVIRKIPSLEFFSLGMPLGRSPFILDFRTSMDGLSRMDARIETPILVQRLDLFPRLTARIPSLGGFSFAPSIGIRETYYGTQFSEDSASGTENQGLHRRYIDINVEMRPPALEGNFSAPFFGNIQHTVEPFVTYRRIHGIKDPGKIIRFDQEDAIADTNEIEYGIVNRFYRDQKSDTGSVQRREFLSIGLVQKYYFDPTFGGAFEEGQWNAFYPLDSVTGLYQTGVVSNLSPLSAIFQLSSQKGIHTDVRFDFDTRLQRWRNTSVSTLWQQGKISLSGTYFIIHPLETGLPSGNHVQGQLEYGSPSRGFYSSMAASFNLNTGQWLNSNTRVGYAWDCCGLGASFSQYDLGLRTESRFTFSFMLKGIGNFGNMKKSEGIF